MLSRHGQADPASFTGVDRDLIALLGDGNDRIQIESESFGTVVVGRNLLLDGGCGWPPTK